jgi:formate hydrogenlyase transcriptional activator
MADRQPAQSIVTCAANQSSPSTLSLAPHCFFPELLEKSQDLVYTHDLDGRPLAVNPAPARILGYSVEELLGKTLPQLLAPEFADLFPDYVETIRRDGMASGRMMLLTRGGERRVWEYHNWLRIDAQTRPFVVGMAHDVTEHLATERAVRTTEKTFRSIFRDAPVGMIIATREGHILDVNRAFCEFLGYSPEELVGQTVLQLIHPQDVEAAVLALHQRSTGSEAIHPLPKRYLHKNGELRRAEVSLSLLQDHEPQSGCFVAQFVDVAERKKAEQRLQDREQQLRMIVQQIPGIFWAVDRDLRFTSSTGKALKHLGLAENQVRGMTLAQFAGTDDPTQPIISSHQRALQGEEVEFELEWGGRFYEVMLSPLREAGDTVTGALGVGVDITEIRQNSQRLETLLEISHCSGSHLEPRALFSAVSECLRKVVSQDFTGLLLWDADGEFLRPIVLDFLPSGVGNEQLLEIVERYIDASFFKDRNIRVLGVPDLQNNGFFSSLVKAGVGLVCVVPLEIGDRPQGILLLGSKREDAFSTSVLRLLTHVAPQLALGLSNASAYQQIKQLEEKLAQEKIYLEQEIQTESRFDEIVGHSRSLGAVLDLVKQVAPTDANVLITGETGTGKELIARAIHQTSLRSRNSFIKLNCAAIPSGLLESELFGFERGAFTSASNRRIGRIELADQGTLFLDEVGDLPLELQPKLLRVLEDHEFERLGSTKTIRVDTRLIAATNRDLVKEVAKGNFRADLFFRLHVFPIKMPALRDRRPDIPLLITHFVQKYATRMKKTIDQIPTKTMSILTNWDWAGNIRELENFIERSVILTRGSVLEAPLAELATSSHEVHGTLQDTTEEMQCAQIIRALQQTGGVIAGRAGAAARLGLKRTTLQSMMQRLGISSDEYRNAQYDQSSRKANLGCR